MTLHDNVADHAQNLNESFSHDIPVSQVFSSPVTSVYDYQNPSTPDSVSNVNTHVPQIQSQVSNVQNTHPYNLRPRNIFGMVKYNNH